MGIFQQTDWLLEGSGRYKSWKFIWLGGDCLFYFTLSCCYHPLICWHPIWTPAHWRYRGKPFVTPRSDRPNMYIMCGTVSWILMCGLSMLLWWLLFLVYCCLIYYLRAMFIYSVLFVVNKWLLSLSLSFFLLYHRYVPPWRESSGLIFNLMFFHWFCLTDSTGICWIQH